MPRIQKYTDAEKISIMDTYIVNECHGKADKIKYTKVADYAAKLGYDGMKEYDFRRCDAVVEHIEAILQGKTSLEGIQTPAYIPLALDKYLSSISGNPMAMAEKLSELNDTCMKYSTEMLREREECCRVRHRLEALEQETELLRIQLEQKEEALKIMQPLSGEWVTRKAYNFLGKKLKSYSRLAQKLLGKDLAIYLVNERGDTCTEGYSIAEPEMLASLFEGKKPEALLQKDTVPETPETCSTDDAIHSVIENLTDLTEDTCRRAEQCHD